LGRSPNAWANRVSAINGCKRTCILGYVSGGFGSIKGGVRDRVPRTNTFTRRWGCCDFNGDRTPSRGRTRDVLVREPDAGNPQVRFDERAVKTEHGEDRRAPANERAGNSYAST